MGKAYNSVKQYETTERLSTIMPSNQNILIP